jgi:hypothetical protein
VDEMKLNLVKNRWAIYGSDRYYYFSSRNSNAFKLKYPVPNSVSNSLNNILDEKKVVVKNFNGDEEYFYKKNVYDNILNEYQEQQIASTMIEYFKLGDWGDIWTNVHYECGISGNEWVMISNIETIIGGRRMYYIINLFDNFAYKIVTVDEKIDNSSKLPEDPMSFLDELKTFMNSFSS